MFNKIYNSIKKYIRENFVELCIYLVLLFVVLCPVNYYIITGGGTIEAADRIVMKEYNKSKGSFHMAYVSEIKGTIFTYLLSYIVPSFERDSIDSYKAGDDEDTNDIEFRNTLLLKQTNNDALYVAYKKANKKLEEKDKKNYIYYIDKEATTDLCIGDEILQVDNLEIKEFSDLKNYVSSKNVGDVLNIQVIRKNRPLNKSAVIYQKDEKKYIGVSLLQDVNYIVDPKVSFQFKNSESGPSGGLIMTLQIYNMLIKKDITNGLKIVGTGTIDKEGNVGEIDGVKYKLKGAVNSKADIFLVPAGRNYEEAMKEKKTKQYKIRIIGVKTFDEAVELLDS